MHIRSRNRNRSRYGGDFFPGRLFLSGAQGAWYDPSDLSTLFQDAAGTTPVTAVEQPVGLMLDKSGLGNHASQATADSRPTLKADANGLLHLEFDGSDDSMSTASVDLTGTDKATIFMGMHKASDAAAGVVLGHGADFSAVGAFEWQANTGANATTAFRGRSSAGSTANAGFFRNVAAPSTFVFASLVDYAAAAGAEFSGRYDGIVQAQNDGLLQENTGTFGNNVLTIGSRQGGASQRFNGRLYSAIILGRAATTAELTATESWINGKTGTY